MIGDIRSNHMGCKFLVGRSGQSINTPEGPYLNSKANLDVELP